MSKPKCLDLFCKAGGMTRGYQLAGFHVTGIDIEKQPHYIGDEFIQADVTKLDPEFLKGFDLVSASPPCQCFSVASLQWKNKGKEYPNLIKFTRDLLMGSGRPYVIENVPQAPLINPICLCGSMFNIKVYRHRNFESNFWFMVPPHMGHPEIIPQAGHGVSKNGYISVAGHFSSVKIASAAMEIDWMNQKELSQAIPPAYSKFIGEQFLSQYQEAANANKTL